MLVGFSTQKHIHMHTHTLSHAKYYKILCLETNILNVEKMKIGENCQTSHQLNQSH